MNPSLLGVIGLLLAVAFVLILCQIFANCIRDENSYRKPFWWIFFLGPLGAILYVLLTIRENNENTRLLYDMLDAVKKPKREAPEHKTPEHETAENNSSPVDDSQLANYKERLEYLENRVTAENPELFNEYFQFCEKRNLGHTV